MAIPPITHAVRDTGIRNFNPTPSLTYHSARNSTRLRPCYRRTRKRTARMANGSPL
jgi:hypothetical protein